MPRLLKVVVPAGRAGGPLAQTETVAREEVPDEQVGDVLVALANAGMDSFLDHNLAQLGVDASALSTLVLPRLQRLNQRGLECLLAWLSSKGAHAQVAMLARDHVASALGDPVRLGQWVEAALRVGVTAQAIEQTLGRDIDDVLGPESFDRIFGVDFEAIEENERAVEPYCQRYEPTDRAAFAELMREVPFDRSHVFLDVGCGKGKILYLASKLGYEKLWGFDWSRRLVSIAEHNLEALRIQGEVNLHQYDAREVTPEFIRQADVLFLFNPFTVHILSDFMRVVQTAAQSRSSPMWIAFFNCSTEHHTIIRAHGFTAVQRFTRGSGGWLHRHSSVFVSS
jgi:predicted RNA methylase